ncbi:MAG: GYF domain-containing protein [Bacteroides sp.]|nr:GYF domain-containing protein [Bacteroides sp.]MCM1413843.1 GYF domain-containing protein [Bacteroides sp.]MCM1471048.1 GYF domain-containing protein [Bacteroides sp.]
MDNWYLIYEGQQVGPLSVDQLLAYRPTPNTLVWKDGLPEWKPLYNFPELMSRVNQPAQPQNTHQAFVPPTYSPAPAPAKDKTVAGLLAIFLGALGIQYFYCGKSTAGVISLLISVLTCGFGAAILGLLFLIQGILMLTMDQQQFEAKYVDSPSTFPLF